MNYNSTEDTAHQNQTTQTDCPSKSYRPRKNFTMIDNSIIDYAPLIGLEGIGLYNYYARYVNNQTGTAFPSYEKISKDTGAGKSRISRINNILEKHGLLKIERGDARHSNQYTLLPPTKPADNSEKDTNKKDKTNIILMQPRKEHSKEPQESSSPKSECSVLIWDSNNTNIKKTNLKRNNNNNNIVRSSVCEKKKEDVVVSFSNQIEEMANKGNVNVKTVSALVNKYGHKVVESKINILNQTGNIRNREAWLICSCKDDYTKPQTRESELIEKLENEIQDRLRSRIRFNSTLVRLNHTITPV